MFLQVSRIPDLLIPWLAVALIIVCLGVLILVGLDIGKNGVNKAHIGIFIPTLATVLSLGFGSNLAASVMGSVRATEEKVKRAIGTVESMQKKTNFFESLLHNSSLGLLSNEEALTRSLMLAETKEDRLLAIRVSALGNVKVAEGWLAKPENRNLFSTSEVARLEKEFNERKDAENGIIQAFLHLSIPEYRKLNDKEIG